MNPIRIYQDRSRLSLCFPAASQAAPDFPSAHVIVYVLCAAVVQGADVSAVRAVFFARYLLIVRLLILTVPFSFIVAASSLELAPGFSEILSLICFWYSGVSLRGFLVRAFPESDQSPHVCQRCLSRERQGSIWVCLKVIDVCDSIGYTVIMMGGSTVFRIRLYKDTRGNQPIRDYLTELAGKTDKNSRIKLGKIDYYLQVLREYGTRAGEPFVKHIDDDIWELRPLSDRIFFFCWQGNIFIMLHHFIK